MRPRSLGRVFDAFQAPLDDSRRVASALGGSVNDAYVTGITGALGLYHERMGQPCETLRMAMPISTRANDDDEESNSFTPARVVVPVQPKDPAARFALVHEQLAAVRSEPAIGAAGSLASLLTPLPTSALVSLTRSQAGTIDFAASNLRGSPVDLYLAGARILANFPMGPRTGCGLNVTLLSYKNSLDMGLNIDPASVTDAAHPARLLRRVLRRAVRRRPLTPAGPRLRGRDAPGWVRRRGRRPTPRGPGRASRRDGSAVVTSST